MYITPNRSGIFIFNLQNTKNKELTVTIFPTDVRLFWGNLMTNAVLNLISILYMMDGLSNVPLSEYSGF